MYQAVKNRAYFCGLCVLSNNRSVREVRCFTRVILVCFFYKAKLGILLEYVVIFNPLVQAKFRTVQQTVEPREAIA